MKSIKAIAAGSLFIIVVILFLQLAYIFIAVAYNALAKDYSFLNDISTYFRYFIGIPVFMVIMFVGGFITANIAREKVWLHCLALFSMNLYTTYHVPAVVKSNPFTPLLQTAPCSQPGRRCTQRFNPRRHRSPLRRRRRR